MRSLWAMEIVCAEGSRAHYVWLSDHRWDHSLIVLICYVASSFRVAGFSSKPDTSICRPHACSDICYVNPVLPLKSPVGGVEKTPMPLCECACCRVAEVLSCICAYFVCVFVCSFVSICNDSFWWSAPFCLFAASLRLIVFQVALRNPRQVEAPWKSSMVNQRWASLKASCAAQKVSL